MLKTIGIGPYLQQSREKVLLSRKQAGKLLSLHPKSIEGYEYNRVPPAPDIVLAMGDVYRDPTLTKHYCKTFCAIGSAYSYVILNNVCLDISSVLLKMRQEYQEAGEAMEKLFALVVNKRCKEDFKEHELREVESCLQELQDLEHNIEVLKIQLASLNWFNVRQLVSDHNSKCYRQGYVVSEYAKTG